MSDKINGITVLLPIYNSSQYLSTAIMSILKQSYTNFEFIIINDGSTDNSEEIISNFKDSRIVYKKIEHSGLGTALNFGLNNATHDWIARIDADDFSHPERLKLQTEFVENNTGYGVISSWYSIHNGKKILYLVTTSVESVMIKKRFALQNEIIHPGSFFNKNLVFAVGGYRNFVFEDFDLWLRLRNRTEFYNIPRVLTFVRYRKDSFSRNDINEKNKKIYTILENEFPVSLMEEEAIMTNEEVVLIKGWREYFWGNKYEARKIWRSHILSRAISFRLIIAFLFTFLPEKMFLSLKEFRLRFRIEYMLDYKSSRVKEARKEFYKILNGRIVQ